MEHEPIKNNYITMNSNSNEEHRRYLETIHQKWEDATIANDYIFYRLVRGNKEICLGILRLLLPELEIEDIEFLDEQYVIDESVDTRGVRLDAFAGDRTRVYDIEMQATNVDNLRKRSRYNQSMIDSELLKRGEHFRELKESYVIFINTFDLFGKGLWRYTFENICREKTDLSLDDKAYKIFINARGAKDMLDDRQRAFLNLLLDINPKISYEDRLIDDIIKTVEEIKQTASERNSFMTLEMKMKEVEYHARELAFSEGRIEGKAEGKAEGESLIVSVVQRLRKGESRENIIASGIDEQTVVLAETIK